MELDKEKSTVILGYPGYYVIFSAGEDDETVRNRIWQIVDATFTEDGELLKEAINREIKPNVNGKVALRNEKNIPIPMMYQDILYKVTAAIQAGKAMNVSQHDKKKQEEKDNLDPVLKNQRMVLWMDAQELLQKAKDAPTWAEMQKYKEPYYIVEDKLKAFDLEHPEYAEILKRKRGYDRGEVEIVKKEKSADQLEMEKRIFFHVGRERDLRRLIEDEYNIILEKFKSEGWLDNIDEQYWKLFIFGKL